MKKSFIMAGLIGSVLLTLGTLDLKAKRPSTTRTTVNLKAQLQSALDAIGTNYTSANIGNKGNNWNTGSRTVFAITKKFNNTRYKGENGGDSIYIKIQGFFDAREAQAESDTRYLINLRGLLTKAKNTNFLDANQKAIVKGWAAQVQKQITEQAVINLINKAATITPIQKKIARLKNIAAKYGKVAVSETTQAAFFNEIKSINNGLYELYLKTQTSEPVYTDEEKVIAETWAKTATTFPLDKFREFIKFCTTKPNFKLLSVDQMNYVKELKTNFAKFNVMVETIKTVK